MGANLTANSTPIWVTSWWKSTLEGCCAFDHWSPKSDGIICLVFRSLQKNGENYRTDEA